MGVTDEAGVMTGLLDAALDYIGRGWAPVPVEFKGKAPLGRRWQDLRITPATAPKYFKSDQLNVGLLLGPASRDLVDVDLDTEEARQTAAYFLPLTCCFGRASAPASHWLFQATGFSFDAAVLAFNDSAGERLAELRIGGDGHAAQTVAPGSVHESGEAVRWESDSLPEPVRLDGADLEARVRKIAAAALIARHWPSEGSRHTAAQALGGTLRRAGWSRSEIKLFVEAVTADAGDPERADRLRAAADAGVAVDADKSAYGLPKLSEILGGKTVDKLVEWLRLSASISLPSHSDDSEAEEAAVETPWPVLDPAAFYGLAGKVVSAIAPHSEADPVAILLQFLCAYGVCCGRTSHAKAEADKHPPQLWPILVGVSSRGRKGTSWGHIIGLIENVKSPEWVAEHFVPGGLSSGEGIIWAVRDPVSERDKKTGVVTETDVGVKDKRLLVVEAEFASVLRQFERVGNALSSTLRAFWDRGDVRTLTKNSPARATGAHVCVIGHITADELTRYLDRTELANGFANRLLLLCVRRARLLPFGGKPDKDQVGVLAAEIRQRLVNVTEAGEHHVCFTHAAHALWGSVYETLSQDRPGIYGATTARAEAQTLRLSLVYALLDAPPGGKGASIDVPHLEAALAVWKYCDASAARLFGKALGDSDADEIYRVLQRAPDGMTRTEITSHFGRHRRSAAIGRALALLVRHELARSETNPTGGRPEERWYGR
jgi:hypothetical protein